MREIKFRAWDEKNKLYIFFDKTDILDGYGFELIDFSIPWSDWDQFTGLHDKNGKEIYEGDIVETETCSGVVCFESGQFGFKVKPDNNYVGNLQDLTTWHSIEIIGNIYEGINKNV